VQPSLSAITEDIPDSFLQHPTDIIVANVKILGKTRISMQ
jgi:hypothetical protein